MMTNNNLLMAAATSENKACVGGRLGSGLARVTHLDASFLGELGEGQGCGSVGTRNRPHQLPSS